MRPIAIWYHTCVNLHREHAFTIIRDQVEALRESFLLDKADQFMVGINGDAADAMAVKSLLPDKANVFCNEESMWPSGEVQTLREMWEWLYAFPAYNILYLHMKGLSHHPASPTHGYNRDWREEMMQVNVWRWRECVRHLDLGAEMVGTRWFDAPNASYWAGNFWWARSEFLLTLGPCQNRSRYDAEVWIGEGPRLPNRICL